MPDGGIVDLVGIQLVRKNNRWRVVLIFADSGGRHHSKTYGMVIFSAVMALFGSDNGLQAGREKLGISSRRDRRNHTTVHLMRLDSGQVANLGSGGGGALLDLSRMLHDPGPRQRLLALLQKPHEQTVPNPWRH